MAVRRYDTRPVSRRVFLGVVGTGLLTAVPPFRPTAQDTLPGAGPSGKLGDPQRAGRPLEPVTARDNLAAIQAIEKRLKCQCGCNLDIYTCRTTDFACSVSPAMHADVMGLVAGGHTAQEILAAFKTVYGEKVLMAPQKSGFNLVGYTMPFVALGAGAVIVASLLRRWKSRAQTVAA